MTVYTEMRFNVWNVTGEQERKMCFYPKNVLTFVRGRFKLKLLKGGKSQNLSLLTEFIVFCSCVEKLRTCTKTFCLKLFGNCI